MTCAQYDLVSPRRFQASQCPSGRVLAHKTGSGRSELSGSIRVQHVKATARGVTRLRPRNSRLALSIGTASAPRAYPRPLLPRSPLPGIFTLLDDGSRYIKPRATRCPP